MYMQTLKYAPLIYKIESISKNFLPKKRNLKNHKDFSAMPKSNLPIIKLNDTTK